MTKKEIIEWLNLYNIKNYTLIPDEKYGFVVDVNNNIYLNKKNLHFIPVKLNIVNVSFDFSNNNLNYIHIPKEIGGIIHLKDKIKQEKQILNNIINVKKNKNNVLFKL